MIPDTKTWERLNAYYDGELDAAAKEELDARLRKEPELQAALQDIRDLSSALKPLHPVRPAATAPRASPWPRRAGLAAAIAASVAVLFAVFAASQIRLSDPAPGPLDWHQNFASRAYSVQQTDNVTPVAQWMGRDFDLSSANLTLVDVAMPENGDIQLHFSGVNGCRLTVGIYADPPVLPAAASEIAMRSWSVGAIHYSMLAEGMDPGKFSAIYRLLVNQTKDHRKDTETLVAVRDATRSAVPCA